ncbi:hypothetical protein PAPYR_9230 [Paratrimastix pyriformis]|uniref:OTU domain-containing protein n=1 Tax=Paratrimastix pyriformis TaxID=342808 RepID=A0ABQ8UBK8_9EUKA|nr:hypothetical protein PAPYR_9230 [Paratrimastix pyriformis]
MTDTVFYAVVNLVPSLYDTMSFFDPVSPENHTMSLTAYRYAFSQTNQAQMTQLNAMKGYLKDLENFRVIMSPNAEYFNVSSVGLKDGRSALTLLEMIAVEPRDVVLLVDGHGVTKDDGTFLLSCYGGRPACSSQPQLLGDRIRGKTAGETHQVLQTDQREWLDLGQFLSMYLLSRHGTGNITILLSACHSGALETLFDDPRIRALPLCIYFSCRGDEQSIAGHLGQRLLGRCPCCEHEIEYPAKSDKPAHPFAIATASYQINLFPKATIPFKIRYPSPLIPYSLRRKQYIDEARAAMDETDQGVLDPTTPREIYVQIQPTAATNEDAIDHGFEETSALTVHLRAPDGRGHLRDGPSTPVPTADTEEALHDRTQALRDEVARCSGQVRPVVDELEQGLQDLNKQLLDALRSHLMRAEAQFEAQNRARAQVQAVAEATRALARVQERPHEDLAKSVEAPVVSTSVTLPDPSQTCYLEEALANYWPARPDRVALERQSIPPSMLAHIQPFQVPADGSCLLHALCMTMWGDKVGDCQIIRFPPASAVQFDQCGPKGDGMLKCAYERECARLLRQRLVTEMTDTDAMDFYTGRFPDLAAEWQKELEQARVSSAPLSDHQSVFVFTAPQ